MIGLNEFWLLWNQEKQQYLLGVFSQVWDVNQEVSQVAWLLESWFAFPDKTLDEIFSSVSTSVQEWKDLNTATMQQQIHSIHDRLQQEAVDSASEADDMLNTI